MMRLPLVLRVAALAVGLLGFTRGVAAAADAAALSDFDRRELATFERKATLAKHLGATHVPLTDGLPTAQWQLQPPNDPYPAWFIQRPDFFKLFPVDEVKPYVDMTYARRVDAILEARCAILRRLGLRAQWAANIPQVMPEAFFTAYPQLRGPRVDQPNRSRTARFSMCVDQPETIRMYRQAMKNLLAACPEIDTFSFLTQDSGSGFCWVPSLYPGINGNSECRDRPMSDRIAGFLVALKDAAHEGGHEIEISLNPIVPRQWMQPSFSADVLAAIVHQLPRGIAVEGREGPDGLPFRGLGSSPAYVRSAFHPVVGLEVPDLRWLRGAAAARGGGRGAAGQHADQSGVTDASRSRDEATPARRLISLREDESVMEFNAKLQDATATAAAQGIVPHLAALRAFAAQQVGEPHAEDLLQVWLLLDDADRRLEALNFGDMLYFGHVLNRWVNRPMVPFPEELPPAVTGYYRRFLFQAKGEEQANDLIDIQGMRMYEGYGARLLFQRVIETTVPDIENAMSHVKRLEEAATDERTRARWHLFAVRLEAVTCLLHSADHMVAYQAQLDRVKALGVKPEPNPPLGTESSWDRTDLLRLAREEIDTTAHLKRLLDSTPEPILDLAPVPEEETIMRLGPDLSKQLQRKIDIMNAHWKDYDRLFTAPNP